MGPLIKVILLWKCQVSFVSPSASWYMANLELLFKYTKWKMWVTVLECSCADSYTELWSYRESIDHLRLPVHRFEEPQVADYPSWGQAEDHGVVIQGNRHHGVFCLPKERYTKKRNMLPWWHDCFIIYFSKAAAVELRNLSNGTFWSAKELEKVICWQVTHLSRENREEGNEP